MAESSPPTLDGGILLTFLFSIAIAGWAIIIYFIIRRWFPYVYFPQESALPIQRTFFAWVWKTLRYSNELLVSRSGLIGIVYLKWKYYSMYFLGVMVILVIPVLIPLYVENAVPPNIYFAATAASSLPVDTHIHWVTFAFSCLISLSSMILLVLFRLYYYIEQAKYKRKLKGDLHFLDGFATKISGLPLEITSEQEILEELMKYNENLKSMTVKNLNIAWHYPKLLDLQSKRKKYEKKLNVIDQMKEIDVTYSPMMRKHCSGCPSCCCCCFSCCIPVVDKRQYLEHELGRVTERIMKHQQKLENNRRRYNTGTVFILFNTVEENLQFKKSFKSPKYHRFIPINRWRIKNSKNPKDIIWKNLHYPFYRGIIPALIGCFIMIVVAFILAVPIAFLSQLSNITLIPGIGIAMYHVLVLSPWLKSFLESLLPALMTMAVFWCIPPFALFLSKYENHHSRTSLNSSAMIKMWLFYILNGFVFLIILMGGIDIIQSLNNIFKATSAEAAFSTLNWSLYGSFYCNLYIAQIFVGGATKRFPPIQQKKIYKLDEFDYFDQFAQESFFFAIAVLFTPIVPLVLACAFIFYCTNYANDKITIALVSTYEYGHAKIFNRYIVFMWIAWIFIFIIWIFFFVVRGPRMIAYVAAGVYGFFMILFVLIDTLSKPLFKRFINLDKVTGESKHFSYIQNREDFDDDFIKGDPYLYPGLVQIH